MAMVRMSNRKTIHGLPRMFEGVNTTGQTRTFSLRHSYNFEVSIPIQIPRSNRSAIQLQVSWPPRHDLQRLSVKKEIFLNGRRQIIVVILIHKRDQDVLVAVAIEIAKNRCC